MRSSCKFFHKLTTLYWNDRWPDIIIGIYNIVVNYMLHSQSLELLFTKVQTPPPGLWVRSSLCSATIVLMSPVLVTLQIPNPKPNYSFLNGYLINLQISLLLTHTVDRSVLIFYAINCSNQLLKDKKSKQALFFTKLIF